jgi:hypothetical protein
LSASCQTAVEFPIGHGGKGDCLDTHPAATEFFDNAVVRNGLFDHRRESCVGERDKSMNVERARRPQTLAIAKAAVDEAHRHGMAVFAPPSTMEGLMVQSAMATSSIRTPQHSSFEWSLELLSNGAAKGSAFYSSLRYKRGTRHLIA